MPDSVIGQLAGKAFIIEPDGTIIIAAEDSVLRDGDIFISALFGHSDKSQKAVVIDIHQDRVLLQEQESLTELMIPDNLDVLDILTALEEGQDPTQLEGVEAAAGNAAGNAADSSSIAAQAIIESGSTSHVYAYAGFTTQTPTDFGLTLQQLESIDRVFIAETEDPIASLTGDNTIEEGTSASYTISISNAVDTDTRVSVVISHKTSESGDITPITREVIIPAGQTSATFSIDTIDDVFDETADSDTFTVSISDIKTGDAEQNIAIPPSIETNILDEDALNQSQNSDAPSLTLSGSETVIEGDSASYTLTLSHAPTSDVTITVVISRSTAEGDDVSESTREITIPAGGNSATFSIDTMDDVFDESNDDDVFSVTVSNVEGGGFERLPSLPNSVDTIINDGDASAPTLTLTGDSSVNEGESASYTITLSEPPSTDMTITVTVGHRTSENGDIPPVTRNILIPAGSVSTTFSVDTDNDVYDESNDGDVFSVTVNGVSGGGFEQKPELPPSFDTTLNDGTADAPTLTLTGDSNVTEGGNANYTLTLSHAPSSDFTVTIVVGHQTSENGDITPETRDVVIAAGTTSTTFIVATADDVFDETNDVDVFDVSVGNTSGGGFEQQPTAPTSIATTIDEDTDSSDKPTLTLTGDNEVTEGEEASYTLTISEAPTSDLTVTVVVGHKTSEDGDVTPVTRSVVIAAGTTSTDFTVATLDDSILETTDDDVFEVSVTGTAGGGFEVLPDNPAAVETTINEDTTSTDKPTLTLTGDSEVVEGAEASYTLTISEVPTTDLTVNVVVGHKTSEDGDVTPVTRDVVVAAGTTSTDFTVATLDDSILETTDDDVFEVSVTGTSGGGFEVLPDNPSAVETTINEDTTSTDKPTLTLTGDAEVIEGAEASYTLSISEAPTSDLTVTVVVGHKTSEDGDVTPITRSVVIAAGTTSTDFTVTTLDDSILETSDDDAFEVSVTGSTGGGFEVLPDNPAAVETTINEDTTSTDKPTLTLTGDAEVTEGEEAFYTLTISEVPTTDLTVTVVVGHKTSEDGDVTPITRSVVIAAGTTSTDFTVATLDDSILETNDDDVFEVSVTGTSGGGFEVLPDNPAAVETTINEDTTSTDKPTLTLTGDTEVTEGKEASYTLTISEAPTTDLTVTVVVGHKTSEDGDVTPVTRSVVIAAGTTSTDFTVATLDDSILETNDDDVFEVSVTGTAGGGFEVLPDNPAAVETTINEDTTSTDKPTLTLTGDNEMTEGEEASYTLTISEAPTSDLTVTVVVGHKTSEDGDVTPVTRNVVIAAGTTSTDFTVATLDDSILETNDDDVFEVSVTGTSGGGFEVLPDNPSAVETTINEDTTSTDKPTLTLTGDAEVTEGEEASYTLTISEAPTSDLTVTVVVGHKTSEDGDVTPVTRSVVIAAGTTSTDFTVATLDDSILETNDDDVFEVSVTGTAGGGFEVLPDNPAAVETTINEDTTSTDKPTLTLTGDAEVTEGEEASYTLSISEAPTTDLTVTVIVGHKTSEDGDVTPVTRSVVIAAGTTSTDFTVATLDDSILETSDDDVFEVSVTGSTGGGFEVLPDNPSAVETTINEDTTSTDKPTLTLTGDSEVTEGEDASYTLTISEAPTTDLTVTVVVGHKTSEDGDVTPVTRSVVIAAGTTSTDFTVATLDDSILETTDDDVFEVSVTGTSGGGFEVLPDNPASVETTINEDTTSTDKPTLTLAGDSEVTEGEEASYTLTISEAPTSDLTVTVVVGHKTSEDGDVTPVTQNVVIAAGTTSTDFTVATLDDSILETSDDDVFEVSVTGTSGGSFEVLPDNPASVETTINEDTTSTDKPTLTLTGDSEIVEGAEASYTLTISEAPTSDLTVTVVVGHKTSEDGDVTPVTRDVVIAAGTTSTDFTVATLDDSILETNDDDVFEVSVTGTSGGGFEVLPDNPSAVETTINEDTTSTDKPTLALTGDSEVVEGAEASYTLTISEAPTSDLTVTIVVGHKTSEDGDVTPVTRDVVISAGTTSTDFTVATLDDSILETNDDDVFEVSVTGSTGGGFEVLPDNPAAVETTINEDTTSTDKPTLTLTGDSEVIEGAEASYTLTISEAPTTDLTVTVVVGHKTSEDGDVTPVTRDVVIAAGTTSTDFTVATLDDSILETNDDDVFEVSVTGSTGGGFEVLPDNPAAVETTINEDTASTDKPTLTLTGDSEVVEGAEASYTLTISEAPTTDLTVTVVVGHKTSEDGDVTPVTRNIVIAAGTTSTDFTVATLDDSILETNDEDVFEVSVTGSTGGGFEVLPDNPAAVETTINEDTTSTDKPTLTLTGDSEVTEGEDASYTLTISEAPTTDLTVTVVVGHKTSEDGDVTPVTRNVVIAAGTTSTDFIVATLDDSILETIDDDVFEVSVTGTSGGGFEVLPDNPSAVETTINEDTTSTDKPTLTLTGDAEVTEGAEASYTLTISESPTTDLTVTVVVGHKTSEDGDVTPVTRSVVIAAGTTSTDFTVATLDDSILETTDDDVFEVSVTGTSGGGFEVLPDNPAAVETTINEDTTSTDKPTLTLAGDSEVTEGEEASYTLTISEAPTVDLTVTVVVGHKTSEDGDVTPVTRSVVIAAGTTSTDFTVATLDDSILETNDDDVFEVSVTGTSGGGFEVLPDNPAAVETTINEDTTSTDKPTLTLTGDAEVTEGEEASYTLTISEAPTSDLTVTVVVGHKTSENGDVSPVTRSVVIAAGTTSTDFTVATLDDSILETNDDDVFEVSVTGSTGGGFEVLPDNPTAVETTINEDTTSTDKPTLTLTGDADVTEGEEASYTLTVSEAPTSDLTVTVVVGHKTSEDGDVTPVTRSVVITAGTTSTDFTVATLDDSILETTDDDVFEVSVTSTSGGGFEVLPDNPSAVETTINEDTTSTDKPTLTLTGDNEVTEGEEASYTLTISEAPTTDLTVTVVVGHKTSEDGDVTPVTRSVVIAAGTTSTDFTVATLDDSILETSDDDVFEVSVTGTSGGGFEVLPDNPASVETTINEDTTSTDKPTLTLTGDAEVTEGEEASYTLTISEAPTVDLTVTVVVGHKTSEDGDVTPVTRSVVIAAGTTSADFTVATLDDSILETNDDDVFEVSVTGTSGGGFEVLPDNPSAVETTINEDTTSTDKPTLTLTGDNEVTEGEEANYTLTISEAPTSDLTVTVGVGHKTSEDGDVTPVTRSVVIAAGTTSTNFTVATLDDSILETSDDDVFEVSVTGTSGGGFEVLPDNPTAVETTINEDTTSTDKPTLTLTGDAEVTEGEEASYTLTISEAPTVDLTVTVVVGHKTSEDGDVTPVTRSVVIAAGTTSTDFTVATLDDSILETSDDDVFEVSVTGTSGGGFEVLPDNPAAVETTINEDTTSTDKPTLTLTGDADVTEGEEASYTLSINEAPTTDLTVTVVVGHKTSEDGDVTPVTRSVVIAAGTTSIDFTVATLDDSILETSDDDVFEVSVTGTSGGGFEVLPDNPAAVETTINEDTTSTDKPTLTLTGDAEVTEGEEASYTLSISEAPTTDLTVTVVVGHKTSEDGDVTPVTRNVVIAAGTTSTDFTVETLDDSILETNDDDVFEVSVTGTSGGGFEVLPDNPAAVETTVNEDTTSTDKPTLTLTGDAEVTEGEEASYTLTISEAPTSDLTVTVVVGHKTSEDGDVTPVTQNVVIAAGTTSTDFTVATLDDSILETSDDDVFEVSVTGTSGGSFEVLPDNPASVETTINEDTTSTDKPTLTLAGDSEVTEGEEASYTLTISEAPTVDLTVTVVVGHKTSEDGDVTPITRSVVIAAGTTSTDFTVATLDDSILETNDDDVFEVSVTGTSGGGFEVLPDNPASVETTINEDTTSTDKPTLTLTGDAEVTEGEEASYTLTISEAPTTDLTVTVVVGHKTSEDGDVTPITRSVVIAAGTTSTDFTVATLDDSILETNDEDVFEVSVTGTSGGGFEVLPDNPAAVETTINEDTTSTDKPTLTLTGDSEVTEGEDASYTLIISEAPTVDLTVTVVVGHKTSEDGDVTPVTRNVVIVAGTTSTDFTVATLDDSILETNDDDAFEVSVTGTSGGGFEVLPDNPAAVETTINEDTTSTDKPTLTLTGDADVTEGEEASYTLSINEAPTTDLTVTVVVGHKTSEDGDVTPVTRSVVIAAGTTSTNFTVATLDDSILETTDDDVFEVSVTGSTGGGFEVLPDNPAAVETTINEDTTSTDKPTLTLTGDEEVTEGEEASYTLTISEAPTVDLTVTVVVGHKTSEDGDVTPVTRNVVIAAGTTSTDFTVATLDDSILETNDDDVFEVSVTGTAGGGFEVLPDNPSAVETIINEDTTSTDKPTLTLTGDAEVTEGKEASYTLTISEAPTSDLTVTVVVGHKTSEDGDVTPVTRNVVIAAGTTSTDFTVETLDDSILETNDEDVFEVSVTGTSGGGFEVLPDNPAAVETTINEDTTSTDKPTLTLTGDAEVTEGEEASYTLTINEAPTVDLTVTVVVGHKTSEDGDVTPVTRSVVIAAGTTSTDFTVETLDDSILETNDDDVFEVSVTGTSGGGFEVLPDNPAAVETTINEDTTSTDKPTLTLTGDSEVTEGEEASYTLTISEAPTSDLTVTVVVGHKTSEDGDVTPVTRSVVIAAGTTSTDFTVATLDDSILETNDDDVFEVSVTGTAGGGFEVLPDNPSAVETTINEDTTSTDKPTLTLTGDTEVTEGEEASYTLTISEAPTSDLTVTVVVGHKTSEDGDVIPVTRDVVISAGTTSTDFTVATLDDSILETNDDDVFEVSVTGTSGGGFEVLPDNPAAVETTINDGDVDAPTLTLTGDSSVEEGSSASYTVSISEAPTSDMTISIVVGHISSENGDVTPETRNVTILAGTTAATFEVSTSNDLIDESADADVFSVSVDGISGGGFEKQPEAPAAVQTTINDGTADAPSLTLTGDSSVDEGETASYTLTVSTAPVSDMNITVVIGHKTSESGDVTPITRTVTIAAGTTSQSFTVATTEDTLNESADNDVFTVSVSNVSGGGFEAQPALPDSIETTIDDDDISSLIEDVGPQSVSGVLQVIDDSDNALTFANTTVVGEYGSLTLVDGDWTYTLYQNAQSLNDGQEVNENITLTATDGTQQVISIAVTGTQDAAVVTGNFTGSVDADGFSINSDETNNVHADSGAVTSTTNAAWTTTSTTINGVPYVIATQWGAGTVSTFLSRVNDDGTLTETDRITYNPNDGTVVTSSGGDITADLTALGIEARSLGNGLTQSNASNIDGQPTLFVTSQNSSSLTAWNISDTGTLSINGGITDINSDDNQSFIRENVTFEGADGTDYIYVTRPGTDGISKLTYDAQTGEMVNTNEFIFGGESVSSIDVFTNDNYDSFLAAASNDAVRIFSIDQSTGALTLVDTATVAQGTSNSVNFYHTSDGRTYAIYANNSSNQATIFEVSSTGELTQTDTVNGAGHYFASAGYIDGEPVYVMPNATQGVDLYTIGQDGKLVFQTNVADIENDWTPPVIVQTEDGSYYLVDSDGEDNGIVSTTKLTFGNSESSNTDDSSVTVSGIIGISDIDSNDNPSFENTTIQGTYGSLTLIDGTWTYTLDKDKSANIPDDETTQDIFTLTATDGTVQSIVIDVTGHQPAIDLSLQGENTGSIIVDLSPQAASPGFVEDSSTGDVAFTLDAYTADLVDDADLSDSLETRIQITSLPNDGVLYYFNDSGTKIAVALNQILPDDTAFVFEPDRSSVTFAASDITSSTQTTIVKDGITVSGGTFSGSKPDSSSTITPANIAWEFQAGESGIGVGDDRELTSTLNEVMVIEFTGSSDITSSNIVVSSAYGNFSDTRPANGQAHAIVYRDGQIVGEYDYPNLWEASGGDGIATINIADPDGFDEIRFYVTATVNSNLNVTSISAEGVNTTETEFSYKAINSLNNESETATVTLGETINDQVSVTTPSKATGSLSVVGASGLAAVFANTTETGLYGEIVLVDGMWTYTVDPTRLDAIPDNQSVQDVITLTATDGTTTDVTIVIGESEGAITNFYTSIADDSLSDIINMNNVTFLGSANDDLIQGDDDEDAILAREGNDRIFGGDGNDTIDLGFGDDFVSGGRGNDILAGGEGEDTFAYFSGDEGTGSAPAVDHISDFNTQEDTLNLTDLLQGETTSTVDQYLNIVDDSQGHAILNISKNGDGVVNQQVVFDNLSVDDMASAYQIDTSNMTAAQISTSVIDAMLMQSKLVID